MSKISLSPSPTGSAVYTIASPAGSTDRTLNLPDSAGTVATAESTLAQFNVTGSAPVFACRAFVNFNGTGTPAIRASGNVSSVSKIETGAYAVNFATAMSDVNYSTVCCGNQADGFGGRGSVVGPFLFSTTSVRIGQCRSTTAAPEDGPIVCVSIFR